MNNTGWTKAYRKMLDNPIVCKDLTHLGLWNYLLLSAAHQKTEAKFNGKMIELEKGQIITSRRKISTDVHEDDSRIDRLLNAFEKAGIIRQEKTKTMRLITIINWQKYQSETEKSEPQCEPPNEEKVSHPNDHVDNYLECTDEADCGMWITPEVSQPNDHPNEKKCTTNRPHNKKLRNSLLRILKNKIKTACACEGGNFGELIDEVMDVLVQGIKLEKALKFGDSLYGSEEFIGIAETLDAYKMSRIVNRLLQKKDTIENREYYILGLLAEM